MSEDQSHDSMDAPLTTEPDYRLGYLGDIELHQDAADVVTVRLHSRSGNKSVDVEVTDESMITLAQAAKNINAKIHDGMARIHDIFNKENK